MGLTGKGATFAFTTSTFAEDALEITVGEYTMGELECTTLASTSREWGVDELVDAGSVTISYLWNDPTTLPRIDGAADTLTITFPGNNTLAGSGYVTSSVFPTLNPDNRMEGSFTFRWAAQPTYTAVT